MRLIDADALKDLLIEVLEHIKDNPTMKKDEMHIVAGCHMLCEMIDDSPTAYAAPVEHARWACDEDFNTVCTGCGKRIPTFHCYNEETDEEWDEPIDKTPFCPNCGAKMYGGAT